MTKKALPSVRDFSNSIDKKLVLRSFIILFVVGVYLLSFHLYYYYMDKKAGYDFLYGVFLYRRAAEVPSKYVEAGKVFKDMLARYSLGLWYETALFYSGDIYYKTGELLEAERVYVRYLSSFPRGLWAREAGIAMGYIAEDRKLYKIAIERYKEALKEFPEDYLLKEIYLSIGRSYEQLKEYSAAKEYYGKVKANYPGSIWAKKAEARIKEIEAIIKGGV